jgi:hypothetical protein
LSEDMKLHLIALTTSVILAVSYIPMTLPSNPDPDRYTYIPRSLSAPNTNSFLIP